MSNICKFPEEVLLMIYKELHNSDLNQCQRVCRSWYNIAHLQFLQSVNLIGITQIEQFIRSIDSNKNSSYLNAVKEISIDEKSTAEEPCHFDKAKIRKLLFRFPNLTNISLQGPPSIFEPFDTRLCTELLKKCPKLYSVSVSPSDLDVIYKLRKLVTEVVVWEEHDCEKFGGITTFLCSLPRLTSFNCNIERDAFRKLLPVFEKLPNITHVSVSETLYDEPNFAEVYTRTRKQDEQDILTKRLSSVTKLDIDYVEGFCENSMQFICKYFTGVKSFSLVCRKNYWWGDSEIQVFCNNILDFACPLENKIISFEQLRLETLSRCLPTVIQKAFYQKPTVSKNRRLCMTIKDDAYSPAKTAKLDISGSRSVGVTVSKELNINQITSDVFGTSAPINDVDEFSLKYFEMFHPMHGGPIPRANVNMYDKILQLMPFLKQVELEIPSWFEESASMNVTCEKKHPLVTKLKLQATGDKKYQSLLNWCFLAFPNLKRLNFRHSSGIWNESIGEFQIHLPKYTLEKLTIDMTPVRRKIISQLAKQRSGEDFFVLELETLGDSKRQLYRIPVGFSSISVINESNLQGSVLGEDYLRVNIIIRSVQIVELSMHKSDNDYLSYLNPNDVKRITLQCK